MTRFLSILAAAVVACNLSSPADLDGRASDDGVDEGAPDAEGGDSTDAGADGRARVDAEGVGGPGPLTMVVRSGELVLDRLCDFDGDGTADNAVADLGSPGAVVFAATITTALNGAIADADRLLFHMPLVEEAAVPDDHSVTFIVFDGIDTEEPLDPTDDFSGSESFSVLPRSVDGCGEPCFVFDEAALRGGTLEARDGFVRVPVGKGFLMEVAEISGTVEPFGAGAELSLCGVVPIANLGGGEAPRDMGNLSFLEALTFGGAGFGAPSVAGLLPDVDLDGDGLERLELDDEGGLVACIDGDASIIEGSECWTDPRMADGFGLNFRIDLVGARLEGLRSGWDEHSNTWCDVFRDRATCDTPPAESAWEPR